MILPVQLAITPKDYVEKSLLKLISQYLKIDEKRIYDYRIVRKSIDARHFNIKIVLQLIVGIDEKLNPISYEVFKPVKFQKAKEVVVVGMGPAGLFASLTLLMRGIKPIIIEQGRDVHQRKRDIASMFRLNSVNEQSNYCFGEGGAGTFSDGKLYTRSTKKGNIEWFLKALIQAGANESIMYEAHPHIGSDKLPKIVENIRNWIIDAGGEVHFSATMTDLLIEHGVCKGIEVNNKEKIFADAVILSTGHSSRSTYELLIKKGLNMQPKGFAMGVRVEHPQFVINQMQYHNSKYLHYLPPAEYKIIEQVEGRGVYSFCMCPGGTVVPAMTEKNTIVVNGMSASKRNSKYANSGFVVELRPEDLGKDITAVELLNFQKNLEEVAYKQVGDGLKAPAQRLIDFMNSKISSALPQTSYIPGIVSSPLHDWLPPIIKNKLQHAFNRLKKRMPKYVTDEAIMIAVESRTSSPVRIPRDPITFEHKQIKRLFPCGEGSGYAGGITSSALDGMNVANAIVFD